RQLGAESAIRAFAGATAGIVLSQWMSALLVGYIEQSDFPVFLDLRPDTATLAATIALATLTVILTGALPALTLTRVHTEEMLRSGAQRTVARKRHPFAASLLPVQVALSLLLASLALLFAISTGKLLRMDPGFRVKGITLFGVDFERRPEKSEARLDLHRRMLEALRQAPGVEAASVIAARPWETAGWMKVPPRLKETGRNPGICSRMSWDRGTFKRQGHRFSQAGNSRSSTASAQLRCVS